MKTYTTEDFKKWGAEGGTKSRRTLTPEQSRAMTAAREARRKPRRAKSAPIDTPTE